MSSSSNAPSPHPQSREVAAEGLLNNLGEASLPADGSLPTRKPRTRARGRKRRGGRADDEPGDGACDEDGGEPGNDELRINGRAGEIEGEEDDEGEAEEAEMEERGLLPPEPPPPQAPPRPPQARAAAAGDASREGSVTSSSHASSSGAAFPNADENNLSEALTHDHFLNNDGEEETPRPGTPETTEPAANKGGAPQQLPPQQPVSALTGLPLDTSNDSTLDTRPLPDTSSGSGDGAALDELLGPMSRLGMVQLSRRERREIARKEREAAAALQQPPLPPSKPPLPPQDGGRGVVPSQPPSLMMEAGGQQPLLADNLILQPPMQTAVVSSLQHHSPLGSSPGSLTPHHLLNLSNPGGGGVAAGGGGGVAGGGSTMLSSGQSSWEAPSPGHTQLPYDYNASPPTHANLINRGGADEGMVSQYGGSQPNPLVSSPLGAARSIGGVQSPGQNNMGLRSPGARQNAVSEGGNANANNNANGGGGVYRDLLNPPSRRGKKSDPYEMQMCHLDIEAVRQGIDKRTTLRVANIPNKLDQRQLLHLFEANHKGCINFFYLPVDFKNEVRTPYQLPLPPSRLPLSPRVPSLPSIPFPPHSRASSPTPHHRATSVTASSTSSTRCAYPPSSRSSQAIDGATSAQRKSARSTSRGYRAGRASPSCSTASACRRSPERTRGCSRWSSTRHWATASPSHRSTRSCFSGLAGGRRPAPSLRLWRWRSLRATSSGS